MASVTVEREQVSAIGRGLLVYLGVSVDDDEKDAEALVDKVRFIRIFSDDADRLNLDVGQIGGGILVVSAFTVQADARRGRRPTLDSAAPPDRALMLYEKFCDSLARTGVVVARGSFRSQMSVNAVNDGPICVLLDSKRLF
jgi:D-tyrosyl-tRNA(Tyr) deacylase